MPAVGGFSVTQWKGRLHYAQPDMELIDRQGLDGHGVIYDAWRSEPQDITTRAYVTASSLEFTKNGYRRLIMQTVTVYDSFDARWDNCLIMNCDFIQDMVIGGVYLLTASWVILTPALRPT